jgi:hypothetical protein
MRRQVVTIASAFAGLALAFVAGSAIASHLGGGSSTPGSSTSGNNTPSSGGFNRGGPGIGGGFFGGQSGNGVIGTVSNVSGDVITIRSFQRPASGQGPGNPFGSGSPTTVTKTVTVTGTTTYDTQSYGSNGPTESSASLSDIKTNTFIIAQGSTSNGTFVATSISISSGSRLGTGRFRPGGFNPPLQSPTGTSHSASPGI